MRTETGLHGREPVEALVELGFTQLEASVYAYLVESAPATGYRIAREIGKPVANTYKAVESLHQKGAVLIEETGENRLCRAVPAGELLDRLAHGFRARHGRAAEALASLQPAAGDEGLYALTSVEQVYQRARAMLARAREVVLVDLFPEPARLLAGDLEAAAARGAAVAVRLYEPAELRGVRSVVTPDGHRVMARWPGQWLNLVSDGAEFLLSFLSGNGEGVQQAVWSRSCYLAWVYHSAFQWEILGAAIQEALGREPADAPALRDLVRDFERYRALEAPGYRRIAESLA